MDLFFLQRPFIMHNPTNLKNLQNENQVNVMQLSLTVRLPLCINPRNLASWAWRNNGYDYERPGPKCSHHSSQAWTGNVRFAAEFRKRCMGCWYTRAGMAGGFAGTLTQLIWLLLLLWTCGWDLWGSGAVFRLRPQDTQRGRKEDG